MEQEEIREAIRQFCLNLAQEAGLALADEGAVKTLHGCNCYEDPCQAWDRKSEQLD